MDVLDGQRPVQAELRADQRNLFLAGVRPGGQARRVSRRDVRDDKDYHREPQEGQQYQQQPFAQKHPHRPDPGAALSDSQHNNQ